MTADIDRPGRSAALPLSPPAPLHLIIILAGLHLIIILATAGTRIASLGVPTALEKGIARLGVPIALEKEIARLGILLDKESGAVVTPRPVARNGDIDRGPARHESTLGLIVQHRDELGAIICLAAERLVRDDDR